MKRPKRTSLFTVCFNFNPSNFSFFRLAWFLSYKYVFSRSFSSSSLFVASKKRNFFYDGCLKWGVVWLWNMIYGLDKCYLRSRIFLYIFIFLHHDERNIIHWYFFVNIFVSNMVLQKNLIEPNFWKYTSNTDNTLLRNVYCSD